MWGELTVGTNDGVMPHMDAFHEPCPLPHSCRPLHAGIHRAEGLDLRVLRDRREEFHRAIPVTVLGWPADAGELINHQPAAQGTGASAATVVCTIAAAVSASMTRRFCRLAFRDSDGRSKR